MVDFKGLKAAAKKWMHHGKKGENTDLCHVSEIYIFYLSHRTGDSIAPIRSDGRERRVEEKWKIWWWNIKDPFFPSTIEAELAGPFNFRLESYACPVLFPIWPQKKEWNRWGLVRRKRPMIEV